MAAARPFRDCIRKLNRLHRDGHYICIFTARTDEHMDVTIRWLIKHRVRYDKILFNKPRITRRHRGYYYIDNAEVGAMRYEKDFPKELI